MRFRSMVQESGTVWAAGLRVKDVPLCIFSLCDPGVGPNRSFRDPWFAPQVAGFLRTPVQIQELEKEDLVHRGDSLSQPMPVTGVPRS